MLRESESVSASASNFRGDKSVTQKIRSDDRRISFRELARFAYGKHAEIVLATATGSDERTVKRWFARNSRPPSAALQAVLGHIINRLE